MVSSFLDKHNPFPDRTCPQLFFPTAKTKLYDWLFKITARREWFWHHLNEKIAMLRLETIIASEIDSSGVYLVDSTENPFE